MADLKTFEKKAIIENYKNQVEQLLTSINDPAKNDPITDRFKIFNIDAKFVKDSTIFLGPKQIGKTVGYNIIGLFESETKSNLLLTLDSFL